MLAGCLGGLLPKIEDAAYNFRKVGHNRFNITLASPENANKFVSIIWIFKHSLFTGQTWVASIPNHKVLRKIVIECIDDLEITPDEIIENLRPPKRWKNIWHPPISARRMNRRVSDASHLMDINLSQLTLLS